MIDRRNLLSLLVFVSNASALPASVLAKPSTVGISMPPPSSDRVGGEYLGDMVDVPKILVVGVGGAGNNAVNYMIDQSISGIEFISVNTDLQSLKSSRAQKTIQLGNSGLGTGGNPTQARVTANQSEHELRQSLDGGHVVFIVAGMGGGTGTGAAPVVARIAKDLGLITVGVVTQPFEFEGSCRVTTANEGLAELQGHLDALFLIPNEKLLKFVGEHTSMEEAFNYTNGLTKAVISGLTNTVGFINVDLEDMRTILMEPGKTALGHAVARGPERASVAAEQALNFPLMDGINLSRAKGVLVLISAAKKSLRLSEAKLIMNSVRAKASPNAHLIYGTMHEQSLEDGLQVTILATGLTIG